MGNEICHFEIGTRNMEKAREFYTHLFAWDIEVDPKTSYAIIHTRKDPDGGFFTAPPEIPLGVNIYFLVDAIDFTLKKVKELGGKVIRPKTEVYGMGWFAMFQDPENNVIGIWENEKSQGKPTKI